MILYFINIKFLIKMEVNDWVIFIKILSMIIMFILIMITGNIPIHLLKII